MAPAGQRQRVPRRFFVLLAMYATLVATGVVVAIMGEWDAWWPWLSLAAIPLNLASVIVTFRTMWTISAPRSTRQPSPQTSDAESSR